MNISIIVCYEEKDNYLLKVTFGIGSMTTEDWLLITLHMTNKAEYRVFQFVNQTTVIKDKNQLQK